MPELQIYEAASIGLLEAVVERMNLGDDVDKATQYGHTGLINASLNNHVEVVRVLLNAGCKVNLMDVNRETALIVASSNGNHEVVKLLVSHGANLTHRNGQNRTAKEMAKKNNHLLTYQFLVEAERRDVQEGNHVRGQRSPPSSLLQSHRKISNSSPNIRNGSRTSTPKMNRKTTRLGKSAGMGMFDDKKRPQQTTDDAVTIREELYKIRYTVKEKERDRDIEASRLHRPPTGTGEKLEAMVEPPLQSRPGWEGTGTGRESAMDSAHEIGAGLRKHLTLRPSKTDLISRGLMFNSTESLARRSETKEDCKAKRRSLEVRLQNKLTDRPAREELKIKGILKKSPLADVDTALSKEDVRGLLSRKLDRRPSPQDLVDRNIIELANVSPLLVATEERLKRRELELALEKKVERRHKQNEIVRQSVLAQAQENKELERDEEKKKRPNRRSSLISHITSKMGHRPSTTSSDPSSPATRKPKSQNKLSFHGEVLVARTYDKDDYDRSPATKRKYTPMERLGIAKELNKFKMYEMEIHEDSKDQIHFIRTPNGLS